MVMVVVAFFVSHVLTSSMQVFSGATTSFQRYVNTQLTEEVLAFVLMSDLTTVSCILSSAACSLCFGDFGTNLSVRIGKCCLQVMDCILEEYADKTLTVWAIDRLRRS